MNKLRQFGISGSIAALSLISLLRTSAGAYDRHVVIINHTSYDMVGFYASNVDANSWEENILINNDISPLQPGQRLNVNVDDGTGHCMYDFKAAFENGSTAVRRRLDVCRTNSWTVVDGNE
jgi:hypothetical protein